MPSSMTLVDATAEVLARIGQLDDGVANPILDAEARAHINAAQRQLVVEYDFLANRRTVDVPFVGGQRFAGLPADARTGDIDRVIWTNADGASWDLLPGVFAEVVEPGTPERYSITPTLGVVRVTVTSGGSGYTDGPLTVSGGARAAGGHDPVATVTTSNGVITAVVVSDPGSGWTSAPTLARTPGTGAVLVPVLGAVQALEIGPVTDAGGVATVRYQAGVTKLSEDDDELALDAEAVIGRAALLLATTKNLPSANGIGSLHVAYLRSLAPKQKSAQSMSLSAWRKDT